MFKWFVDNQITANQDKCHLIVSKTENVSMHIGPFEIKNTNCEKLLGIKVDSRLNFNDHLDGIIKASRKINALSRITPFMNISNSLHERVLRILYSHFKSSFENLLEKDVNVSIHAKNRQKLATETFKISKNFSVPLMSELFHQKFNHYDPRNPYEFSIPNVNSVFHGQGSISYLGPLMWQLVPSEFIDLNNVSALKQLLGNGSQATAHAGYVKHILGKLDSFKLLVWG